MPHSPTIYTIGHSTRSLEELVAMLKAHGVSGIADVRKYPGSRRLPQFNAESLTQSLPEHDLQYFPFPNLGGRRRPFKNSPNSAWRNESFRGYADYMQTPAFVEALDALMTLAKTLPLALMCAEAVPWRCHRSLIGDALLVRGWRVLDVMSLTQATAHKLTPFAKVDGLTITYPPDESSLLPGLVPKAPTD